MSTSRLYCTVPGTGYIGYCQIQYCTRNCVCHFNLISRSSTVEDVLVCGDVARSPILYSTIHTYKILALWEPRLYYVRTGLDMSQRHSLRSSPQLVLRDVWLDIPATAFGHSFCILNPKSSISRGCVLCHSFAVSGNSVNGYCIV